MDVPEYDFNNPVVLTEDEVISRSDAEIFDAELVRIAGLNPFGKPNLVRRWGVTYCDPMNIGNPLKYPDFTNSFGTTFGERRFFIEIWRSPEFLKRSGRYKVVNDPDRVIEFYFCKACDAEIECGPETLAALGDVPACKCGSKRHRVELIREAGSGRMLQDFPAEGCYDYWLRLERANLTYHPPDGEILEISRALWQWELTPQNRRDELEQADREIHRRQMIAAQRRAMGGVYTGAVHPLMIPT